MAMAMIFYAPKSVVSGPNFPKDPPVLTTQTQQTHKQTQTTKKNQNQNQNAR
jgi:hypothetical protein